MFDFLKKEEFKIVAVADGKLLPLSQCPDQVFASKMMGDGFVIDPSKGTVVAPITGTVTAAFPTGHAVGITSKDGIECLVHIGIDTVNLNGKGFTLLVNKGDKIKAGKPVVKFDKEFVTSEGYVTMIMTVFPAGYKHEFNIEEKQVQAGDILITE